MAGVEIEVRITGPRDNLMTELTSPTDPELGQADLTSLLLTGHRMDDLGAEQAAIVGAQVLGSDVLGFAGRAVGLDTLRVGAETNPRDPADVATEVDPNSRVTFGKSFGRGRCHAVAEPRREQWSNVDPRLRPGPSQVAFRFVQDDEDLRSYAFRHDVDIRQRANRDTFGRRVARGETASRDSDSLRGRPSFP